jgi:hypothetical protein
MVRMGRRSISSEALTFLWDSAAVPRVLVGGTAVRGTTVLTVLRRQTSIPVVRPNWPGCGQPWRNGGRRLTDTCGPSRTGGCPSGPARTAPGTARPRGARVGGACSGTGGGVRHHAHDGHGPPPGRVRGRIERAAADGAPEQLKQLLDAVVEQIQVESRACIQPYFVAPTVRTRTASRRRTTKHTNTAAAGAQLWVTTRAWGRSA